MKLNYIILANIWAVGAMVVSQTTKEIGIPFWIMIVFAIVWLVAGLMDKEKK